MLVVAKPRGPTSSFVVQRVRRLLAIDKIGHTGTLDPMATGVLPLCLGRATALAQLLTGQDKTYRATLKLGARTDSGDADGQVTEERPVPALDAARVEAVLRGLVGPRTQVPPMVSALKVDGQRLHALARQGKVVERAPRPIVLQALTLERLGDGEVAFEVRCSKGTYVRVLGEEIAERLGTLGHLTALERSVSGRFALAQAVPLDALERATPVERQALVVERLLPMEAAIDLPRVTLGDADVAGLKHGRQPTTRAEGAAGVVALMDGGGKLVALGERAAGGKVTLTRVLIPAV